jgi:hypothetical protein
MRRNLIMDVGAATLAVAFLSGAASAGPTTFAQAKELSANAGKPLLLDFYAQW